MLLLLSSDKSFSVAIRTRKLSDHQVVCIVIRPMPNQKSTSIKMGIKRAYNLVDFICVGVKANCNVHSCLPQIKGPPKRTGRACQIGKFTAPWADSPPWQFIVY